MNEYTASNGIAIERRADEGRYQVWKIGAAPQVSVTAEEWDALREFFRAEEDERLGRWRWPENPDYVVIPLDADYVRVFAETGVAREFSRDGALATHGKYMADAARAYFDAHPEPKPWHDARTGEVWALKVPSLWDGEKVYTVVTSGFYTGGHGFKPTEVDGTYLGTQAPLIDSARRIWPEETV